VKSSPLLVVLPFPSDQRLLRLFQLTRRSRSSNFGVVLALSCNPPPEAPFLPFPGLDPLFSTGHPFRLLFFPVCELPALFASEVTLPVLFQKSSETPFPRYPFFGITFAPFFPLFVDFLPSDPRAPFPSERLFFGLLKARHFLVTARRTSKGDILGAF